MNLDLSDILKRLPYWLFNVSGEIALIVLIVLARQFDQKMLTAWAAYLLGALCLMRVWWFITAKIPFRQVRQVLRLLQAAILLVPCPVNNIDYLSWAPAVVMSALEGLFVDGGSFSRAGVPLLVTTILIFVLYVLLELIWHFALKPRWMQKHQQRQQELAEREALLEESRA